MKIDMHVHVTPEEISKNFERISKKESYFSTLSHTPHNRFVTAEQIREEMKESGIDRSVIFGFSFQDMGLCRFVNDYVIEKVKLYPNEFIGFISVVPNHKETPYEIERCYNKGLRGIGELFPAGQPFDITARKDTDAFAACCKAFNLPVILHVNEPVGHLYAGKTDTPLKAIETFISHYSELSIILAHFGGGIFVYELMKEIRECFKNVYYDNAAAIFLYDSKIYKNFATLGLIDKLLFGSDYPLIKPRRYEESIQKSGLTAEEIDKIYSSNATCLLQSLNITI